MSEETKMEILKGIKLGFSIDIIALSLGISEEEVKLALDSEVKGNED